eukprot:TRINITY_DN110943_c0_g1_i1.p1 TRINITY_DN110943_c0_g1~~TRINITY_DN110943_c0_g1_i1.p1  ORF type:complete len:442 (+),score=50.55 TRINITY_DN110943_c0_g1_i1:94-1419(+)
MRESSYIIDIPDLLQPLSVEEFQAQVWGKRVFTTSISDKLLDKFRAGFGNGELADVLPHCRNDNNLAFTQSEIDDMQKDFDDNRATVNLPFCFTAGADEIRNSFIDRCSGWGNDVEVGCYFSRPGGEITRWHYDNNHNITIQVSGQKDWFCMPGSSHTTGSRAMDEPVLNRYEHSRPIPPTSPSQYVCHSLQPGSVIYLPPGHWHQVATCGGEDSFSVDIRVGNVLHCRWICEALFSGLLSKFYDATANATTEALAVGPDDYRGSLGEPILRQLQYVAQHSENMLRRSRLPRCFPFEREISDGMHKYVTLDFLKERGFLSGKIAPDATVGLNKLCRVLTKRRDESILVVEVRSESSLSKMEYLRCSLLCGIDLAGAVELLVSRGSVTVADLRGVCKSDDLMLLLCVLVHGNVLYADPEPEGPQKLNAEPVRPVAKKRKKRH